jgi:hypothetical protein
MLGGLAGEPAASGGDPSGARRLVERVIVDSMAPHEHHAV